MSCMRSTCVRGILEVHGAGRPESPDRAEHHSIRNDIAARVDPGPPSQRTFQSATLLFAMEAGLASLTVAANV